jgi:hypothetical protein
LLCHLVISRIKVFLLSSQIIKIVTYMKINEEFYLLGYNAVWSIEGQLTFRKKQATCFMLVSCLAYSSTLKMEVTCSSETLAGFQWTTQHYIPQDRTLHKNCCETLKSYTGKLISVPIYLISEK